MLSFCSGDQNVWTLNPESFFYFLNWIRINLEFRSDLRMPRMKLSPSNTTAALNAKVSFLS